MYKRYRNNDLTSRLDEIGIGVLDIMVTGVTGAGKSTTLNSVFQKDIAKIGSGVEPETMNLTSYNLNGSFRLRDTPGLGDSVQKDTQHAKNIVNLLYKDYEVHHNQYGFIDMVLVIIEGSSRDMGTTYKLLNEVIVPNFQKSRIVVAINQADMAMKGRYWDYDSHKPMVKLKNFLDDKAISIQKRVKEATGIKIIKPIYYSAQHNYNVDILLDILIDNMPNKKRELLLK